MSGHQMVVPLLAPVVGTRCWHPLSVPFVGTPCWAPKHESLAMLHLGIEVFLGSLGFFENYDFLHRKLTLTIH